MAKTSLDINQVIFNLRAYFSAGKANGDPLRPIQFVHKPWCDALCISETKLKSVLKSRKSVNSELKDVGECNQDKLPTVQTQAGSAVSSFFEFNFQISMHILSSVHSLTLSLSRVLQSENQDLGEAIELADAAKQVLLERRENAEKDFRGILKTVSEISAKYDIELRKPRLASKQTQRSNVQTDSVQDYFRITIYIPYIDLFLTHILDRFLNHRKILSNFACLFPNKMKNFNEESCAQLFEPYSSILRDDSRDIWVDEVKLWRQRIAGKNVKNSLEALDVCNGDAFPNVHQMLRILAVLPVTTATNERSFSTLRRLKTYLRSTMSEDRLNGLASLNIHRDVEVDPQRVLEKFFSTPRSVNLLYNN
ncbi:52 kDa repressor of the inhibitor of the protein kinase-like [Diabrotica virgifera virgifera]|uniref:HAT C-terminal dimerisation domain-containing protein n=1 Tax=Diabrotica virgifera virgifera TaxID=50390 RepID=A0ABM5KP57_DIAVI|nr:52 kDa repressor of the inhibitor of the protein kinase-like [Diabrotica virgifera virgifera]